MKKFEITVPSPCHEKWNNMSEVVKGRFCNACSKTVIDFSSMSDHELALFFNRKQNNVCGRFMQTQLNKPLSLPTRKVSWFKYFIKITIPAFLFLMKASAQKQYTPKPLSHLSKTIHKKVNKQIMGDTLMIGEIEITEKPAIIKNEDTIRPGKSVPRHIESSQLSVPEYQPVAESSLTKKQVCKSDALMVSLGGVVVVSYNRPNRHPIRLVRELIDTAFKNFIVYPNPVSQNTTITLKINRIEKGDYYLTMVNNSGQDLPLSKIIITDKNQLIPVTIPQIPAGNYFIKMVNKHSGRIYTEKIIVQ